MQIFNAHINTTINKDKIGNAWYPYTILEVLTGISRRMSSPYDFPVTGSSGLVRVRGHVKSEPPFRGACLSKVELTTYCGTS
jgi:hypothetical protein